MQWKSRAATLSEAVNDWAARGLLPDDTAQTLHTDIAARSHGWDFRTLLVIFGVLCLGLAAITFVAANWPDIPRPARLALIGGTLWAAWIGTIWAGRRGALRWFEGLSLLACALYGAAIMLVAQLYHIQGAPVDAVWLWALGTLIAAALLRATMPLALAIGLFFLWFALSLERDFGQVNLVYLGWWLLGALAAGMLPSRFCGHLSALALIGWVGVSLIQKEAEVTLTMLATGGALVVVALVLASQAAGRWLRGFESAALFYALALASALVVGLHVTVADFVMAAPGGGAVLLIAPLACLCVALWGFMQGLATRYDLWITAGAATLFTIVFGIWPHQWLTAGFALALFVWITRMGWRLHLRRLRVLGIMGFVAMLLILYAQTLGSLIGTAGFYLGAGLILLAGALIAPRLVRKRARS
ncbi:DUF2157 domain-containing protein [Lutimaribacter sp. EGI FJ00015]|uniref:DUF2157 domain-containing protein n=1 Tax=Lutimaribacter degradans TaxID=2945989 RepID=A0ACC5ZZM4_9RHOB|nr:DUF2157 domain-containing protein [Lutimaribacter sp. EGI FJ00013]MCM2563502.1 DUF2157 domain-containing protein [Lutimaribacter sp. EGI FJ00013]MCO0614682.1 DUF2157 domain-containing protein [Lutimaribacter sp. EGI FJ00015]MCO0637352.1 DUF2157 domain-containing protein [Lutimaribacter sp. EGI FJ00014]